MDDKPNPRGRAWVEIDLDALSQNVADMQAKKNDGSEIMAVVKANAYGHGVAEVTKRLLSDGIKTFAVATVSEAIELRKLTPDSDILVLGYTKPEDACFLFDNNLSQLVVDGDYAKKLNDYGQKLRVHIAIDTGMHRLGIEAANLTEIESVYNCKNLIVEAVATHLSSSDSLKTSDIDFSNIQIERYNAVIRHLKDNGCNPGKTHSQSSYGIYNYPDVKCDYIRPGIMLYGVHSQTGETKVKTGLHPVLSLRAVIAQVKWLKAGEFVSYSRTFITDEETKIATVCLGYADGYPRHISSNNGKAIVDGIKVPIIGRICMDMLILDVTEVEGVKAGDVATFIGKDKGEEILSEEVAEAAGTITNDLLSGLSNRLPRVYG